MKKKSFISNAERAELKDKLKRAAARARRIHTGIRQGSIPQPKDRPVTIVLSHAGNDPRLLVPDPTYDTIYLPGGRHTGGRDPDWMLAPDGTNALWPVEEVILETIETPPCPYCGKAGSQPLGGYLVKAISDGDRLLEVTTCPSCGNWLFIERLRPEGGEDEKAS